MTLIERISVTRHQPEEGSEPYEVVEARTAGGEQMGYVIIYPENSPVWIDDIHVGTSYAEHGVEQKLLERAVSHIGPGVDVVCSVEHEQSKRMLTNAGYFAAAAAHPDLTITDPETLRLLPLVQLFEDAGFEADAIRFQLDEDEIYAILSAHTEEKP